MLRTCGERNRRTSRTKCTKSSGTFQLVAPHSSSRTFQEKRFDNFPSSRSSTPCISPTSSTESCRKCDNEFSQSVRISNALRAVGTMRHNIKVNKLNSSNGRACILCTIKEGAILALSVSLPSRHDVYLAAKLGSVSHYLCNTFLA